MSAAPRQWTPSQLEGIRLAGCSALVSAAAGSGKTAMLAERCAHLVCEAPKKHRCDVTDLLVVTFTDAAAAEMRSRIAAAIRAKVEGSDDPRLARQLDLIDQMQIGTLHGFCARVLRQHFHRVGLDPAFSVLDPDEAKLLRSETARELFDDAYELDAEGSFQNYVDAFGDGDDAGLVRRVVKTHDLLGSLVDPADWLERSMSRVDEAAEGPLLDSELGRELAEFLQTRLADLSARCDESARLIRKFDGFDAYLKSLGECRQILNHWSGVLREHGLDALCEEVAELEFPRLPSIRNGVPNKELAKAAVDAVRDEIKKGDFRKLLRFTEAQWREGLLSVRPHMRVHLDLVRRFGERYAKAKAAARTVDFADLERFTLAALREPGAPGLEPSDAARAYHRRFRYVLVDEYQDINEVQDAILSLVSKECLDDSKEERNLFCVGDVKQSIYRFRLAEAGRFLERERTFRMEQQRPKPRGKVIDLQANFRSRAALLETINGVFARLMTADAVEIDYDETQRLKPGQDFPPADRDGFPGAPMELLLLPARPATEGEDEAAAAEWAELDRAEREAQVTAKKILSLVGADGQTPKNVAVKQPGGGFITRPARWSDIVVLLRSMRHKADQFADVLRRAGVPVHCDSGTGYFESQEVRDMLALLSLLNNRRQDIPLAAALRGPLGRLPEAEEALARVRLAYPDVAFHEAAPRYAAERDDATARRLREFFSELDAWRQVAQQRPVAETIATLYEQTGFLAYCGGLHDGAQRQANLLMLQERARQFGAFHRQGLARFLHFLERLREESDLSPPAVLSASQDVVRILSVHRSKGLEFPIVLLPDLGKAFNLEDCKGAILTDRRAGLGMSAIDDARQVRYPSLASKLVEQRVRRASLSEEMRVLYVAMTRAQEHLILIGSSETKTMDGWRERWSRHEGPLPPDAVLEARTILDWIGPVAAAAGPRMIESTHVSVDDAAATSYAGQARGLPPERRKWAELKPLDAAPPMDEAGRAVVERLAGHQAATAFSNVPAARAMTSLGPRLKSDAQAIVETLPRPRFMAADASLTAAEIGEATHLVLQRLEFKRPCDEASVAAQIDELVERRALSAAAAKEIDRAAIAWFCGSEAGELLRRHASDVLRELPVHLPQEAASEPRDRMMLRGRIDVVLPLPDGLTLIDYKTDRVSSAAAHERAESYRSQTSIYRDAIERITGQAVRRSWLVFLSARKLILM